MRSNGDAIREVFIRSNKDIIYKRKWIRNLKLTRLLLILTHNCGNVWLGSYGDHIFHIGSKFSGGKVLHNGLRVAINLKRRGCKIEAICEVCGDCHEFLDYMFFQCRVALEIWSLAIHD